MKKYVLFFVVLFVMISCQEDVRFNNPSFQGIKDNVFWRAIESKATLASDGSVLIEAYTRNEVVSLKTTSIALQKYLLGTSNSKTAVFVVTDSSGEVTFTTGVNVGSGEIVITEYDNINNTLSGTFKFSAKNTAPNSTSGPILNFYQGVFYKVPVRLLVP